MADEDGCYYIVKPGDNINEITKRFGVRFVDINKHEKNKKFFDMHSGHGVLLSGKNCGFPAQRQIVRLRLQVFVTV